MAQTWASASGGIEMCKSCGAKYKVTITRYPCKDSDSFNCVKCGKLLKSWNDTESPSFTLIEDNS